MRMGYKICPNCGKQFWDCLENRRKYCSKRCRYIFNGRLRYYTEKRYDREYIQRNLERLKIWKEKQKQEKLAAVGVENANPPAEAGGLALGGETK